MNPIVFGEFVAELDAQVSFLFPCLSLLRLLMELLNDLFIKIIAQVSFSFIAFVIASASHGASQELGAASLLLVFASV